MPEPRDPKKTVRKATAKKTTASKPAARKPAARRPTSKRPAADTPAVDPMTGESVIDPHEEPEPPARTGDAAPYRPVAVMGDPTSIPTSDEIESLVHSEPDVITTDAAPEHAGVPAIDEIEHPMRELGVGLLGALLAALTFMPWYRVGTLDASGWSSGTWGPVVFGLGVATALIVLLRRLRVPLTLPVHHAVVLEVTGWACVGLLLLKRFMPPSIGAQEMAGTSWLLAAIVVALVLALAGGSVSQAVAVVLRPGWFRSSAGKLGAAVLGGSLLVGVLFGFLNNASTGLPTTPGASPPTQFKPGYPDCAQNVGVPIPEGVTAKEGGAASPGFCYASLQSDLKTNRIIGAYAQALRAGQWEIVYDSRNAKAASAALAGQLQAKKGSDCVAVTVTNVQTQNANIILIVGPPESACALGTRIQQQQDGEPKD